MGTNPGQLNFGWDALGQRLTLNGQVVWGGIVGPFFSPPNAGIIYYDGPSNRFKASENGGAPINLLTGGGGGSAYTFVKVNGVLFPQEDTVNFISNSLNGADVPGVQTNVTLNQSPAGSTSVVGTGRLINTTAPIAGGGDLSADRTLSMHVADATHDGYLSQGDWNSFNAGGAGGVPATRNINTTAPLTGGGNLSADRTLGITQSGVATDGFLSSIDWNTFNNKVSATRAINTGTGLTGGGNLSADRTLSVVPNTTNQQVQVAHGGVVQGTRKEVNLVDTGSVTWTVTDNPGSDRVDVSATTSGGSATFKNTRVHSTAAQSIPNTTFTALTFDTADWDDDTMFSLVNPTRLTCVTAGKYLIIGDMDFTLPVSTTYILNIRKNGTNIYASQQHHRDAGVTLDELDQVQTIVDLTPGDYVEFVVWQNGGGAFNSTPQNTGGTYYVPTLSASKIG
jgi:hypothetical protein